ncbi:MAG: hypothetical protein GF330_03105 [Candidatus Eisenbacteria bacterium]|nr:hypothetical protein [Candidatus Eisenbacteria bacterium]
MGVRALRKKILAPAPQSAVWRAWTTSAEAQTFFAPRARIDLRIGGRYEMLFLPDNPAGQRGAEGVRILSFLPEEMLSFEWNAPPQFPEIRTQKSWVVVQLAAVTEEDTQVRLTHLGWGVRPVWEEVYAYFDRAWDIVLGRLQHRAAQGPLDWANPYRPPGT